MREIEILKNGKIWRGDKQVKCPLPNAFNRCTDECAWFTKRCHPLDKLETKHAYCKDHCIGRIK